MKRKYHKWTNDEVKVLIGMYNDGVRVKDIANTFNVSVKAMEHKLNILSNKNLIERNRYFKWTEKKEKELAKILHKNEGILQDGFREFAQANNINKGAVEARYYDTTIPTGRVKDKYFIFSLFGRFRKKQNGKIYRREDSSGYNAWTFIKSFFN